MGVAVDSYPQGIGYNCKNGLNDNDTDTKLSARCRQPVYESIARFLDHLTLCEAADSIRAAKVFADQCSPLDDSDFSSAVPAPHNRGDKSDITTRLQISKDDWETTTENFAASYRSFRESGST